MIIKRSFFALLLLALGLAISPALTAADNSEGWKRLGQQEVDQKGDRDEISVGANEGIFNAIKIEVLRADVEFINVRVVYASGDDQNIEIRKNIKAGGESRAIDLEGRNRLIKKVVFIYKASRAESRRPIVVLFGRK
jgi:hypothetical protein